MLWSRKNLLEFFGLADVDNMGHISRYESSFVTTVMLYGRQQLYTGHIGDNDFMGVYIWMSLGKDNGVDSWRLRYLHVIH